MDLKKDLFDEYSCKKPEKINVDADELMKVLKRCKNSDLLKVETDDSNLNLSFEGDSSRSFNLRLIDVDYESPTPPKVDIPVRLDLPVTLLSDFLDDMLLFGENVKFIVDEDYLRCQGNGALGDSEVKYIHGENINEVVESRFSINKIKDMLKAKKLASNGFE